MRPRRSRRARRTPKIVPPQERRGASRQTRPEAAGRLRRGRRRRAARPEIAPLLQRLAARVAEESGKETALECVGFDAIPDLYRRLIKDMAVQAVRNAVVHGIEPRTARENAGQAAGRRGAP